MTKLAEKFKHDAEKVGFDLEHRKKIRFNMSKYEAAINPDKCKASVPMGGRSVGFYQCSREPMKDGWCWQHHPDKEKQRDEKALQKAERKIQNSSYMKLRRANDKLKEAREIFKCIDGFLANQGYSEHDPLVRGLIRNFLET